MSEEEKKYDNEEIQEYSEAYLNAKNKIYKKPLRIDRILIKDPAPLNIPLGCKKFDSTGKILDKTELSVNGEEGLDLLNEIRFLKGLIDAVDSYGKTYSTSERKFVSSKITNGQNIIPFENTKLYRDIKYEKVKFMDPSKITGVDAYLDVDKIFPVITKGRPIDYDKFSEKLNDETPSMQVDENRCYVIFEKFLDTDKRIKVKSFFNPLCNQIGFFMFIGEPNPDKTSADKYVFDKICFRSFYKVINNKIVFRPYSHLKPPLPASRPRNQNKSMKNIILDINTILGNDTFKITTTYEQLMDIISIQTDDQKDKLFNVLLPLDNDINKALFKTACGRIKNRYNEFEITEKTNYYNTLTFLKDKKLGKSTMKEIFGFFIKKEMFDKKIETLNKKHMYYMKFYNNDKKLTIDKFQTQVIPIQMGTPNLAMEDAITIKRFLKLDPIFELYKTKEVQFRKIDRDHVMKQEDIVFDANTYMKDIEKKFDDKAIKLRLEQEPRNFSQFDAKMKREKEKFLKEEKQKFEKKYGEGNKQVYVKFEQELYEPVSYAYFRPFTLSDIILTRYRRVSLFDHFRFSKEPSELSQNLNTLFYNIEELRSFVFTFVSLYYQFKTDISSKKVKTDIAGRLINSAGAFTEKAEFVETGPIVRVNLYKIYPNQLYSKEDHRIRAAEKNVKYYSNYQKMIKSGQKPFDYNYFLLKKEDPSNEAKPLKFLELEEGIVGEARRPEYINPDELFVPELEIGIVERNVEMINKAFTKLTTLEARITEWSGPSEDEIPASVEIKVSPDGSMAARLKTVKDMPQIMRTYVKNITRLRTKIAERKEEEEEEDDDEDDDEDNDNDQGLGNYEGSSDKSDSNVEDGEDNEDGDGPTGLIGFRTQERNRRDKRPDQTKKEIGRIFMDHLQWLIKPSSNLRGVAALKEVYNKHTDKKTTMEFIKKQAEGFNKKLAYEIEEHKERFRESILQWKMALKNNLPLDEGKKSILTFYFQSSSNVTESVITAFILYLNQLGDKVDKDLSLDKIPKGIKAPVNNEQKSVSRLVGDDVRVSINIIQTIFESLEKFKDEPSHSREYKVSPEYLEKADLYWTLRNSTNQSILRDKIQGYVYIFRHPEKYTFEVPEENAIFEDLYNADFERNIKGLKSLIEFLNKDKLIKMKKHFPRKLNDEAEDKAARDAIIRENEELVKEIITLRELKDLTKEQFGEIERKMLQLKEDAKRISQNIDSELERINASGKAKFKKFDKVAEQEARAAANRGEESTVASKLATLSSKPVTAPVDFEDTPAGREKRKLADKHRKHIRKLEEKFLLLRRNVEPGNPSLIEAERAYKDAVKYGNDTYGLGIVELEEAKEESRAVMEERIQITAESIISRLNELDSQRRKLFTEMHNLPKLVKPDRDAAPEVQMEFNRLNSIYGRQIKQANARYEQANDQYKENISKAARYGVAVVYVDPKVVESANKSGELANKPSESDNKPGFFENLLVSKTVSAPEVSSELPSVLSSEPATEDLGAPKVKKVLDRKALTKQFKSDFGNLVAILGQLETNPTNDGIKSRVKTSYEKYTATKIQFIESFRSDAEAEIKRIRTEKKAEMDLIDAYEAKRGGGNSEGNKQKYMKYKLKYMKLKELLGL